MGAMAQPDLHRPEVRLVVSGRSRVPSRVQRVPWPSAPEPTLDALVARVDEVPDAWGWTLSGGEPTLRADLPELVRALAKAGAARLGLATDGLALARPDVVASLADWGVERVRIGLHSARVDANDWLSGAPGSTRRVRKALEACAAAGLRVELETVITRPVMPLLEEVVLLGAALGARVLHLRRPRLDGPGTLDSVTLSPRFGLLQPSLEGAIQTARRRGLQVLLHDLPHCAAPNRTQHQAAPERWLLPEGWESARPFLEPAHVHGCPACPAACPGAPADYVARFGRTEFDSEGTPGEPPDPAEEPGVPTPPPRAGWAPSTRVSEARLRASVGRPDRAPGPAADVLRLPLAAEASTRQARLDLVRAAQQRPRVLRLVGAWLEHDSAAGLLAETRYFDPEVEAEGPIDRLATLPDRALGKLGKLVRVDALLLGPDATTHDEAVGRPGAFDATLALLPRLEAAGIAVQLRAAPRGSDDRAAFVDAWRRGALPGEPAWHSHIDR